jgi:hypothetical protein
LENSSYKLNEPIVNDAFEDQGVRFLDVNVSKAIVVCVCGNITQAFGLL